jgi:site-specific DNA-methyltransferase (adenine-specific)
VAHPACEVARAAVGGDGAEKGEGGLVSFVLHHGDCLDPVTGLASLRDRSVDILMTDPPYSEHVDGNSIRGNGNRPGGKKKALGFAPIDENHMRLLAMEFGRVTKRWVIVFCAVEQVSDWKHALDFHGALEYVRCGAWIKDNATPQFTGDRPAVGFEAIVIAHRPGKKRWNGGGQARCVAQFDSISRRRRDRAHDSEAGRAHGITVARLH